jgi:hypothetical protein
VGWELLVNFGRYLKKYPTPALRVGRGSAPPAADGAKRPGTDLAPRQ